MADAETAKQNYLAQQEAEKAKFIAENKTSIEAFKTKAVEDFKALLSPPSNDTPGDGSGTPQQGVGAGPADQNLGN